MYGLGDYPNAMKVTPTGEILVAGTVWESSTSSKGFVVKFDSDFNVIWSKEMYTAGNLYLYSMVLTPDDGYLVAGCTETSLINPYGLYMAKLNSAGNIVWSHTYEGYILADVCLTHDSGFAAAGQTIRQDSTGGHSVICVTYVDSSGNLNWTNTFGANEAEVALAINQGLDNCFIVSGLTYSFGVSVNSKYLLKIKSSGDFLWAKTYDSENFDNIEEIIPSDDSGYVLMGTSGHTWSINNTPSTSLMKTDNDGNILWSKVYIDSLLPVQGVGYNVVGTLDDGFAVLFYAAVHNTYVLKTDSVGRLQWVKKFGVKKYDASGGIGIDLNGDIVYASGIPDNEVDLYMGRIDGTDSCAEIVTTYKDTTFNPVIQNVRFQEIRLFQNTMVTTFINDLIFIDSLVCGNLNTKVNTYSSEQNEINVFPNPSNGVFQISFQGKNPYGKLEVCNILGEIVFQLAVLKEERMVIDLSGNIPGIYFIRLENGDQFQTARICLTK